MSAGYQPRSSRNYRGIEEPAGSISDSPPARDGAVCYLCGTRFLGSRRHCITTVRRHMKIAHGSGVKATFTPLEYTTNYVQAKLMRLPPHIPPFATCNFCDIQRPTEKLSQCSVCQSAEGGTQFFCAAYCSETDCSHAEHCIIKEHESCWDAHLPRKGPQSHKKLLVIDLRGTDESRSLLSSALSSLEHAGKGPKLWDILPRTNFDRLLQGFIMSIASFAKSAAQAAHSTEWIQMAWTLLVVSLEPKLQPGMTRIRWRCVSMNLVLDRAYEGSDANLLLCPALWDPPLR